MQRHAVGQESAQTTLDSSDPNQENQYSKKNPKDVAQPSLVPPHSFQPSSLSLRPGALTLLNTAASQPPHDDLGWPCASRRVTAVPGSGHRRETRNTMGGRRTCLHDFVRIQAWQFENFGSKADEEGPMMVKSC